MKLEAKTLSFTFLALVLALAGFPSKGYSQETGQITGAVLDPADARISGAKITVKSVTTGAERQTKTTDTGVYTVPSLQPGRYTVIVDAPGFATAQQMVDVGVGSRVGLDIRMKLEAAATSVVVETALVNTETQTLGQLVSGQEIVMLPTLTRNPYDLVQTVSNVSEGDPGGRGAGVAINGLRSSSTNVLLDGVANNDDFVADVGINVPLDSVQEFNVITSGFTAEYGRASAGVVNVATRVGSNDFHGTAYEFNRISRLASNTYENNANSIEKPVFTRNQFGFSVGGPIKKNKLMFFENTEWIRIRSSQQQTAVIATPALIAATASNTQQFFQTLGTPKSNLTYLQTFTNGDVCTGGACTAIPASTPIYQKVSYAVPADSGGGDPQNTYTLAGRVDYVPNDRNQIFYRIALEKVDAFVGTQTNSPYAGYDTSYLDKNQAHLVSWTRVFSPTLTSQTKLSFNRFINEQPLGDRPAGPTLYTTRSATSSLGGSSIVYPGYTAFQPGTAIPAGGPQNFGAVSEDVSWTHGNHTFRFGGVYTYHQDTYLFGAFMNSVEALGTNSANALNGLITGQLNSFQSAMDPQGKFPCIAGVVTPECTVTLPVGFPDFTRSNRYHEPALYAQDSWKTTRTLTLNLGLRWEYYGPQHNKDPRLDSNFYLGPGANIQQQIGTGQVMIAPDSPIGGLWKKEWTNFAPRVGFAWDVSGEGKMSLRGGYGIGYERNFGNVTFNVIQNPPAYATITLLAGTDIPSIPITTDVTGPLSGGTGSKALPATSLRAVDPNIKTAYAHQWSLALERQLQNDVMVGLEYSGSRGSDLYTIERLNIVGSNAVYGGTATTSRINPQYGLINYRTNAGNSIYHAMTASVEFRNLRRLGLTMRTHYTWSHAIDTSSSTFTSTDNAGVSNLGALDPLNPQLDRGSSDFDVRHRLSISGVWQDQFFAGGGVKHWILGGWNVAPIVSVRSGTPFTVQDCTNAGEVLCPRVMFTKPFKPVYTQTATGNPNEFNYLDLSSGAPDSSYVNPIAGISDFGPYPANMAGRNVFKTPGVWKFDLGIYKDFPVTERTKIQFRAEAFNLFNHSNLYIVYSNLDVGSFSGAPIVTAVRGLRSDTNNHALTTESGNIENRNLQLAIKVIF